MKLQPETQQGIIQIGHIFQMIRMLIINGSGSGKTNTLLILNLINQTLIKIYLYAKDSYVSKYQLLIKKREDAEIKHCNDPKSFMEYSNSIVDIYNNINNYTPNRNRKILIAFDGILRIWTQIKKFQSIVKKLFIKCRKLNISLAFVTQSYLHALKDSRLNSKHYLTMKTHNKRELQHAGINHSANIDYKDL